MVRPEACSRKPQCEICANEEADSHLPRLNAMFKKDVR